jgi:hypothetical protein
MPGTAHSRAVRRGASRSLIARRSAVLVSQDLRVRNRARGPPHRGPGRIRDIDGSHFGVEPPC